LKGQSRVKTLKEDVTDYFVEGARKTLKITLENNCEVAILKANSPSCGSKQIYDGTFNNNKKYGIGVTCSLLIDNGIKVIDEEL
jgi:uncharacterized protein YbbK (DUF523 family)